jgi:hypothetical protein
MTIFRLFWHLHGNINPRHFVEHFRQSLEHPKQAVADAPEEIVVRGGHGEADHGSEPFNSGDNLRNKGFWGGFVWENGILEGFYI